MKKFSLKVPGKKPFVIAAALTAACCTPLSVQAADAAADSGNGGSDNQAATFTEMFSKGKVGGNVRMIYFSTHNNFFSSTDQDTVSYGGKLGFTTATLNGFSAGVSGFIQRGIGHSSDPAKVDGYLGPNVTAMGEAYLKWQHEKFNITLGNQQLEVPFAASYDWRMAPQLFQGVAARYGDADNYVTAFRMYRYKSYIDNTFTRQTTYNSKIDYGSIIGTQETSGFWGLGGERSWVLDSVVLKGQAWNMTYLDYANLTYLEGQVAQKEGNIKPFIGAQLFYENGSGREMLGNIRSRVYGVQVGAKRNSITASLGFDRIVPDSTSYGNGALVTPYAHYVGSGPLYAQPFLSSTQDLGAGNAYAFDLNGALNDQWFVGGRYSYMDLKSSAAANSIRQSEYLAYAIYKPGGALKNLTITNFIALQSQPGQTRNYWQNRLAVEYAF